MNVKRLTVVAYEGDEAFCDAYVEYCDKGDDYYQNDYNTDESMDYVPIEDDGTFYGSLWFDCAYYVTCVQENPCYGSGNYNLQPGDTPINTYKIVNGFVVTDMIEWNDPEGDGTIEQSNLVDTMICYDEATDTAVTVTNLCSDLEINMDMCFQWITWNSETEEVYQNSNLGFLAFCEAAFAYIDDDLIGVQSYCSALIAAGTASSVGFCATVTSNISIIISAPDAGASNETILAGLLKMEQWCTAM